MNPTTAHAAADKAEPHFTDLWAAPGPEFGHYRIEQNPDGSLVELGRGGMGVTYLATDQHLQLRVVLKFISPLLFRQRQAEERFLREARIAARLVHPHVASVRQLEREGARWFYAMEFVPGEDLERLVRRHGPLTPEEVLTVARQVTSALAEAERLQLVHRDLKPANLMIEQRPGGLHVKVIDFGLAKQTGAPGGDPILTEQGMVGTPHYASPEQLREEEVDGRSDFYSLGATLWFALTGRTIFTGTRSEVIAAHLHAVPDFAALPRMPGNLAAFLESCLQRDRNRRAPDAAQLLAILDRPARGRWRRPQSARSRRVLWVASLGVLLLGAGAIGGRALWKTSPPPEATTALQPGDRNLADEAEYLARAQQFYRKYTTADNEYAIALLRRGIETTPDSARLRSLLALAYCQRVLRFGYGPEALQAAEKEAERAWLLDQSNADPYAARALVLYARGEFETSERELRYAAGLAPEDANVRRNLAVVLRERGKLLEALQEVTSATRLKADDSASWSIRGNLEKKLERYDEAETSYRQAARLSPSTAEPQLGLVHTLYLQRRFDEAERELDQAANVTGDEADALCLRAQLRIQRDDLAGAEEALRRAIAIKREGNPRYFGQVRYLGLLGWVLTQRGNAAEGARLSDEALALDRRDVASQPRNGDFHASLAGSLAAKGQRTEAVRVLAEAMKCGWNDFPSALLDPRWLGAEDELRKARVR